jgi:ethanolamine utilization protein EutA (predicted chaperonin)
MLFNRKQITVILLPFIAIILSMIALSHFKFKPALSSEEQNISKFSYKKIAVIQKQPITVTDLKSPIDLPVIAQKDFPKIPLSEIFPRKERKVLLILISENRKMAIINDIVVKEGDIIDHGKVKKIERNRVLIKDKEGEEWIKIEQ